MDEEQTPNRANSSHETSSGSDKADPDPLLILVPGARKQPSYLIRPARQSMRHHASFSL
jgi:hypothetical protein